MTSSEHHHIDDLRADLQIAEDSALVRRGWKNSSYPATGHVLWEKRFDDGRTLLVQRQIALAIEGITP